ncbi:hypothetical protein P7K49_016399 [Saguinus oedipus]|uniref:Uncharacterized protein n=1 Tax=Saguinus oedipus TaxID=9490 RepID=A0ABQ9VCJ5_SAGOE|nr:hypothetical protein P7K49_016399 [Saguinus oedipus]
MEGEIFKLEMLLEDVKEKMDKSKYTSAPSLPVSFPFTLDNLASTSSSLSNEESRCFIEEALSHCGCNSPSQGIQAVSRLTVAALLVLDLQEWQVLIPKEHPGHHPGPQGSGGSEATGIAQGGLQEGPKEELCELPPQIGWCQPSQVASSARPELLGGLCMCCCGVSHILHHFSICVCFVVQEDPKGSSGRQECAETTALSPSCTFCRRLLEWPNCAKVQFLVEKLSNRQAEESSVKQKVEKKGHRSINCGRFSIVLHEKALHSDSTPNKVKDECNHEFSKARSVGRGFVAVASVLQRDVAWPSRADMLTAWPQAVTLWPYLECSSVHSLPDRF